MAQKMVPIWVLALTGFCLLAIPPPCFSQVISDPAALPPQKTTVASVSDASIPSLEDLGLPSVSEPDQTQTQITPTNGQTAPGSSNSLSLQDLGFTASQTQSNAQMQARLEKRTHMLKVHQELGLLTTIPLVATVIASGGAKTHKDKATGSTTIIEPGSASVDLHAALGSLTVGMYGATAYYAIFAPKIPGVKPKGAIRVHRALAFIHGPGMVLTPILGAMALNQENQGEKVHGIASAHSYVAWTTVAAYGASIVAVSWPIHWKFWEHP
jgi:hypothetical protein